MRDKDKLEEFIKREVNRIEFDDADAMWQKFQGQLGSETPTPSEGFWYWFKIIPALLLFGVGAFFLGNKYNQAKEGNTIDKTGISATKGTEASDQAFTAPVPVASTGIGDEANNNLSRSAENNTTPSPQKALESNSNFSDPAGSSKTGSKSETKSRNIAEKAGNITFTTGITDGASNAGNTSKGGRAGKTSNVGRINNAGSAGSDSDSGGTNPVNNSPLSTLDSIQTQETATGEDRKATASVAVVEPEALKTSHSLLEPIATIDFSYLMLEHVAEAPSLSTAEIDLPRRKNKSYYFRVENSFASNTIRQHAIGFGKIIPLHSKLGINIQAGGSMDAGYSFSQDSLFIFNGLNIKELRKNKDLKYTWNAYLGLGGVYRIKNWQFGAGGRLSYALFNQFYFEDITQQLQVLPGTSSTLEFTRQEVESGPWDGINRIGIDAYVDIDYRISPGYSAGLFVGKELNRLINNEMAERAYSNRPVRFGVTLNKHF